MSFVYGTSICPECKTRIHPMDLMPIVSYLILRGKCRHCCKPISLRYPVIESVTGLAFLLVYNQYSISWTTLIGLILASVLIIITMIDIDTMEIYDRFHVVIMLLALAYIPVSGLPLFDRIIGFFIISVPFLIIALITNGLGGGDIKLIAAAGLLLGYRSTLVTFIIASIFGGMIAIMLILTKQQNRKSLIAFGPYLCVGIFIAFLYGRQLFDWYMSMIT